MILYSEDQVFRTAIHRGLIFQLNYTCNTSRPSLRKLVRMWVGVSWLCQAEHCISCASIRWHACEQCTLTTVWKRLYFVCDLQTYLADLYLAAVFSVNTHWQIHYETVLQ